MTTDPMTTRPRDVRTRLHGALLATVVVLGLVLRVVLYAKFHDGRFSAGALALALAAGALFDLLTTTLALLPVALALSLATMRWLARPKLRFATLTAINAGLLFMAACEYFFFDEFNARFNHIAVDYVLFPNEVFTNIWESYNVPEFVALALAVGALAAWPVQRWLRGAVAAPLPWMARLRRAGAAVVLAAAALAALRAIPAMVSPNRIVSEIAQNGLAQLWRAFATAHLDYDLYYRTAPQPQAYQDGLRSFGFPPEAAAAPMPEKRFQPQARPATPHDVVVILEESLGSEFVGAVGAANGGVTPGLDRWAQRGLLCENLVATGNRTVRGLESVLCSMVPLPGDSIVKRDRSEDVASIARVLKAQGYRTEFFYGGAGTFDNMKPFMTANGWDAFIEDGIIGASAYPKDAYRTAWGVADEYIFDALLAHQLQAKRDGTRFLGTAMSVSNHKPFLIPPGHPGSPRLPAGRLAKYAAITGGLLLLYAVAAWFARRRGARPRQLLIGLVVVLVACGVILWVKVQPRGSRTDAVRYSDWAVARYLDQARDQGLLEHTVVLIVGDHGARVYGQQEIPAPSYRIPALFLSPDPAWCGKRIRRLCSQIDLPPTLLSLAGVSYAAPFFGDDLLPLPDDGGRAFLNHNRDIGLLTDDTLVVLGLQKSVTFYRRPGRGSDDLALLVDPGPRERELEARAAAAFQTAYGLYQDRRYRLPRDGVAAP